MTTEELNALIAQAESGDVSAMNQLTHIYGVEEGFINHEQAAKWFLELIKRDCNLNSGVYENTGYNKGLYKKIKNAVLNSATEGDMLSSLSRCPAGGSLLGGAMYFTTSNAKSYINQAEDAILRNIEYKEEQRRIAAEEKARKRAEEERLRREAEERAKREREERKRREREEKERQEREKRAEKERLRREAEERAKREREEKKRQEERAARERREREERERKEREEKKRQEERAARERLRIESIEKDYIDFNTNNSKHWKYVFDIYNGILIIPNGVTRIGNYAFQNCSGLASIEIPDSVTSIGVCAFRFCSGMTSIKIPNSVINIEKSAFSRCDSLTCVTIGDSVTSVGNFAFYGCTALTSVTIPNSVTSIGDMAFSKCSSLKKIIIPKGTKQRFAQMEGLKGLEYKIVEE